MQYKFQVQFETAILKLGFRDYNYTCSFAIRTTIVVGAKTAAWKGKFILLRSYLPCSDVLQKQIKQIDNFENLDNVKAVCNL